MGCCPVFCLEMGLRDGRLRDRGILEKP